MSILSDLGAADVQLGGKAGSLAWLAEQGLPTPRGFAITDVLFRALCPRVPGFERMDQAVLASLDVLRAGLMQAPWPSGFCQELHARLGAIGASSYAVRSSFASEDLAGQLAPGVYESRRNVPLPEVELAIRQVLCSALAPGAVAYAMAHGQQPAKAPVAVLVHAFLLGQAEGSAAFAPGRMAEPLVTLRRGQLPVEAEAALGKTLASLATTRGPLEIEWVFADGRMVYLQARPFEAPASPVSWLGFDDLPGDPTARALWRWDVAHNPLPLSPAQAGLVELVDGKCSVGIRQRVLGGYLFCALDQGALPPSIAAEAASEFFASLRAEVEARLARLGARPDLEEALALFVFAYQPIFGVLQPALRQAHAGLRAFLENNAPAALGLLPALRAGVASMASERRDRSARIHSAAGQDKRARADYLALFGDEAPVWDVCAATYAETPDGLLPDMARRPNESAAPDWQGASAQVEAIIPPSLHEQWHHLLGVARTAVSLGEADDWLYARTQAAVRRALLGVGKRLHDAARLGEAEDIFYLPLALARAPEAAPALAVLAAAGRKAWSRARRFPPPLPDALDNKAVRGTGTGGRVIGRVAWHRPGLHATTSDMILVSRTLLPTELPLISAIAIVSETGGLLDHVAAQARERGIPAVVGAHGASSVFAEGDLVLVDGDAGLVVKIS
ncbi:MAG TPA: PEP/pyruvate-binding domain-containing protein [Polyangia bacterium]